MQILINESMPAVSFSQTSQDLLPLTTHQQAPHANNPLIDSDSILELNQLKTVRDAVEGR
jgi:hypothetical protein